MRRKRRIICKAPAATCGGAVARMGIFRNAREGWGALHGSEGWEGFDIAGAKALRPFVIAFGTTKVVPRHNAGCRKIPHEPIEVLGLPGPKSGNWSPLVFYWSVLSHPLVLPWSPVHSVRFAAINKRNVIYRKLRSRSSPGAQKRINNGKLMTAAIFA